MDSQGQRPISTDILIVEDSPDDLALLIRCLQKFRLVNHIRIARDGAEALTLIDEGDSLPCLIILDLKLPKLSGVEVLRRIRLNPAAAQLPVVIFTSSADQRDLAETYASGANSYVQKPVSFDEFNTAVGKLGHYWLILNRPPLADSPTL